MVGERVNDSICKRVLDAIVRLSLWIVDRSVDGDICHITGVVEQERFSRSPIPKMRASLVERVDIKLQDFRA